MKRVYFESFWLLSPDFTDVFIEREISEDLEPFGEVIGHEKDTGVRPVA